MNTRHAWFSAETALRTGSSIYRKPGGSTVNITRTSDEIGSKAAHHCHDEKYMGVVLAELEGGCVRGTTRVKGICD